jgi:hypothetical protein
MRIYGVTGTNGKTTTTKLANDLFRATGVKAGMISTVGARIDEVFIRVEGVSFHSYRKDDLNDWNGLLAKSISTMRIPQMV